MTPKTVLAIERWLLAQPTLVIGTVVSTLLARRCSYRVCWFKLLYGMCCTVVLTSDQSIPSSYSEKTEVLRYQSIFCARLLTMEGVMTPPTIASACCSPIMMARAMGRRSSTPKKGILLFDPKDVKGSLGCEHNDTSRD